jgi:hydrogenase expression/formation protein HypE
VKEISLSSGNGGKEGQNLVQSIFYEHFSNEILLKDEDGALLKEGLVVSTDSFTVSPLFFEGGDIGKLSICGSCNDVAMMGAKPEFLSAAFIIEEGFAVADLEKIVRSMAQELEKNGAKIVCGDTKVVPKGAVDKLFINTTAFGYTKENISAYNIKEDDVIIVSGDIARHGAAIFAAREGIELESKIQSDCASLWSAVEAVFANGIKPKAMRDATRGGVAAVLNEWAQSSDICIEIDEEKVPVCMEVQGICEILGFDAMTLANEGTFLLAVDAQDADMTLECLKRLDICKNAAIIGKATTRKKQKVLLNSSYGTSKPLEMPSGELLPRIC